MSNSQSFMSWLRNFEKEKSPQQQLSSLPGRSETFFFLFFFSHERNSSRWPRCIKSTFEIVNTLRVFCFLESSGRRPLETEPTRWKCRLTLGILVQLQGKVHISGASGQSRLFSRSIVAGGREKVATHVHHS